MDSSHGSAFPAHATVLDAEWRVNRVQTFTKVIHGPHSGVRPPWLGRSRPLSAAADDLLKRPAADWLMPV